MYYLLLFCCLYCVIDILFHCERGLHIFCDKVNALIYFVFRVSQVGGENSEVSPPSPAPAPSTPTVSTVSISEEVEPPSTTTTVTDPVNKVAQFDMCGRCAFKSVSCL